ncbi:pyridoxal phosphate-dependent aminotransferase [Clostridium tarantellae]|uniref:Aminotransferase n=1 Tax=Clostridium tarantellae TaxID=39493 RepID=A0A6I1MQS2_9CLOT|nr:aminotransferase class I/II-fold pyridoxal phosphate-dependent enzyme [Clostridium tarantellae]MPQ42649.1 aminotransferase class I/II-fold pyridoxal phosphate-dependent enzyme [Clostridium tarantellae]
MNKNIKNIEISGIRKFFNKMEKYPNAISLTLGQPDFDVPDKIKEGIINALNNGKSKYTPNAGIIELREAISEFLKTLNINYSKDEIMLTVGGSEGLFISMVSLLNAKDSILIPSIAYPAYESIAKLIGVEIITYELNNDFSVNIDNLKEGIKKGGKVLILSYPCNPTGALLSKECKNELIEVIKDNDICVITDEIYASLCFEDNYYSVAQCDEIKDKIIYVSGFSKMFAMPGLRLGYVCCKKELYDQILKVHQYDVSCASSIVQWGALTGLKNCLNDVEYMKKSFKDRMEFVYNELLDIGFEVNKPNGAFYIFPSISKYGMKSEEFCEKLLKEKGVACVPGDAFGVGGEGFLRISYCYSMDELKIALKRLREFVKTIQY